MGSFAESIRINSSKILEETQIKCYTVMDELFTSVVDLTPVGATAMEVHPGLLKNNWFSSIGDTLSTATTETFDASGYDSKLNIAVLKENNLFLGKDSKASLTNNLDYAVRAEMIGWYGPPWKGTAPYAMVDNSLSLVASKYKD